MKQQISPAVAAVIVIIVVAVVGFFLYKGTAGGGNLPVGTTAPGNNGPFSPGGAAVGQGAKPGVANTGGNPGGMGRR